MAKVCRTCLAYANGVRLYSIQEELSRTTTVTIKEWLEDFYPEMDLNITADVTICSVCISCMCLANDFKIRCKKIEDKIQNYVKTQCTPTSALDLGNVVQHYNNALMTTNGIIQIVEVSTINEELNMSLSDNTDDECTIVDEDDSPIGASHNYSIDIKENEIDMPFMQQNDRALGTTRANVVAAYTIKNEQNFAMLSAKNPSLEMKKETHTYIQEIDALIATEIYNQPVINLTTDEVSANQQTINDANTNQPHSCNVCAKQFKFKNHLTLHLRSHSQEPKTPCTVCTKKFKIGAGLKQHMRVHRNDRKPLVCPHCVYYTFQKALLSKHIREHLPKQAIACNVCGKRYFRRKCLKLHMKLHKSPDSTMFACTLCEYQSMYKGKLERHAMLIHKTGEANLTSMITKPQQKFKCTSCDYSSAYNGSMQKHIAQKHPTMNRDNSSIPVTDSAPRELQYKCKECIYASAYRGNLKKHVQTRHLELDKHDLEIGAATQHFDCHNCEFTSTRKSALSVHMRRHTNLLRCDECPFKTSRISTFERHQNWHMWGGLWAPILDED